MTPDMLKLFAYSKIVHAYSFFLKKHPFRKTKLSGIPSVFFFSLDAGEVWRFVVHVPDLGPYLFPKGD